jgi:hypothetical protein
MVPRAPTPGPRHKFAACGNCGTALWLVNKRDEVVREPAARATDAPNMRFGAWHEIDLGRRRRDLPIP